MLEWIIVWLLLGRKVEEQRQQEAKEIEKEVKERKVQTVKEERKRKVEEVAWMNKFAAVEGKVVAQGLEVAGEGKRKGENEEGEVDVKDKVQEEEEGGLLRYLTFWHDTSSSKTVKKE